MMYVILFLLILGYLRFLSPLIITYQKVDKRAKAPTKAYHKAACFDVYSLETKTISPGNWKELRTGLVFAPWPHIYIPFLNITFTPFGNVAYEIHTRSGLALKRGIRNHLGIIDNDYRGEITIIMYNHQNEKSAHSYPYTIKEGDKIAQIKFYRVPPVWMWKRNKLSKSNRGENKFGSSGR